MCCLAALCHFGAARAGAAEVLLRWTTLAPAAYGYRLHVGSASRRYTEQVDLGGLAENTIDGVVHFLVRGLSDQAASALAVTAYNASGESPYSNEKLLSPLLDPAPSVYAGANREAAVGEPVTLGGPSIPGTIYAWFQTAGPPVLGLRSGSRITIVGQHPGTYWFLVVAATPRGLAASDTVRVRLNDRPVSSPTASPTRTRSLPLGMRTPTPTPTSTATPHASGAPRTRLYLTSARSAYQPPAALGRWSLPPTVVTRLSPRKAGTRSRSGRAETIDGTADVGLLWAVSDPLEAVSFPPGTRIDWGIEVSQGSGTEAAWHVHLYLIAGDTGEERCTLLTNYRETARRGAWPPSYLGVGPKPRPPALRSCREARPGDRLAMEIGYRARNLTKAPRSAFLAYGGTAPDVVLGGTGGSAWVDLIGAHIRLPSAPRD